MRPRGPPPVRQGGSVGGPAHGKDAVARIALGVVIAGSAGFIALGASQHTATPIGWGLSMCLGGFMSYLPWRRARSVGR